MYWVSTRYLVPGKEQVLSQGMEYFVSLVTWYLVPGSDEPKNTTEAKIMHADEDKCWYSLVPSGTGSRVAASCGHFASTNILICDKVS